MGSNINTGLSLNQWNNSKKPSLKLSSKEVKEFREWIIEYQMRDFGFSRKEAEQFADIAIHAYGEIGQEQVAESI